MPEKRERKIPILHTPEILKRINHVRAKISRTDRTDHLAEVSLWEEQAKKALILISLKGHEGIQMIIDKAKSEVAQCNKELISARPVEGKSDAEYVRSRQFLFDRIDLWIWFLNLFVDSEEKLKEISANLDLQDETDTDESVY